MSIRRKLVIGAAGIAAFIVGGSGLAILQMIIGGLTNMGQSDTPGKMEPSPEEKTQKEWEATQQKAKSELEQQSGQQDRAPQSASDSAQPETTGSAPELNVPQYRGSSDAPESTYRPPVSRPAPVIGPGNFDVAPRGNSYSGQSGPGNM